MYRRHWDRLEWADAIRRCGHHLQRVRGVLATEHPQREPGSVRGLDVVVCGTACRWHIRCLRWVHGSTGMPEPPASWVYAARMPNVRCCCRVWRPQVAYFTSANIVGLTDSCVIGTGAVWGKLTTSAAAALTGDACNGFSNGNGASVNPEAFAHFTAQCTAKFTGGSYGACSVFTAAQVRYTGVG